MHWDENRSRYVKCYIVMVNFGLLLQGISLSMRPRQFKQSKLLQAFSKTYQRLLYDKDPVLFCSGCMRDIATMVAFLLESLRVNRCLSFLCRDLQGCIGPMLSCKPTKESEIEIAQTDGKRDHFFQTMCSWTVVLCMFLLIK